MFKDKRPGKWILLAALLAIALFGLVLFFGMSAKAKTTASVPAKTTGQFLPIKEMKTPGGITVWMVEDHTLPIMAMKYVFLDSGSALDPEDRQGLARMLSNTMDEGAGEMDSQTFQKALSDNSISLTFSAGRDTFGGDLKTLTRNQPKAFDLLALAMNSPRFDEEPVARMRDGNISRIKSSLSEPEWMAARLLNDKAFSGQPYAKNSGGTLSSLGRIMPQDLRDFKTKYLTQDRLLVAVAGDIKPETIGPAIDKVFGKLVSKGPAVTIPETSVANPGKTFLYEQNIPQTMVQTSLPAFDHKDKDYFALQVMNYVYGGAGFGSHLMEQAREKRGLTYGIYTDVQDFRHADALALTTSTKNESAGEMVSIIKDEMTKMQGTKVGDKELADAKSYLTGSMPLALGSTEDIAGIILSLRASELPIDYLDHYADNIRSVSADDVQRVAKRILKPETMVTILVGKPAGVTGAEIVKELPNVQ